MSGIGFPLSFLCDLGRDASLVAENVTWEVKEKQSLHVQEKCKMQKVGL